MSVYFYTSLITLVALLQYFGLTIFVSYNRVKHSVKAPKITGNEIFERVFRIHQNTLEQIVLFLPLIWLFGYLISDLWAGLLGFLWVLSRFIYAVGYYQHPDKRTLGVGLSWTITTILILSISVALVIL
jgi:glutathione S-transferase